MKAYDYTDARRTWHVEEYDLTEYLRAATEQPPHPSNVNHHEAQAQHGETGWDRNWHGGTLDEARNLRSWPEGVAKLATINLDGCAFPRAKSRKRVRRWADEGDEFSRDRLDAGYADCWETRKREVRDATSGAIRLTVELSASAFRRADELIWNGVAAAKLVDVLENAGYRVEVAVTSSGGGLDTTGTYDQVDIVHVKAASDPLNLDALLLAAAHPLFFRFHVFASYLRRPVQCNRVLGHVAETPYKLRGDIHVAKVFTKEDAERVVRQELERRSDQ